MAAVSSMQMLQSCMIQPHVIVVVATVVVVDVGCGILVVVEAPFQLSLSAVVGIENLKVINNPNNCGNTILHFASVKGNTNIILMLLKAGASVTSTDQDGNTPLHWAALNNQHEVVALLLYYGADVNILNKNGCSPLHEAILKNNIKVVEMVLNTINVYNAQINQQDSHSRTPLYMACEDGYHNLVELLLKSNVDVNMADKHGRTPLHMACRGGYTEIVQMLLQFKANVNMVDEYGKTPLHMACSEGYSATVLVLLQFKSDINVVDNCHSTPLHMACLRGHHNTVEVLLQSKADINVEDRYGRSPLHVACYSGHSSTVKVLLKFTADVNIKNKYNNTPLHLACYGKHSGIVEVLLKSTADVKVVNNKGDTPLHVACGNGGDADTVKILLQHKPDVNLKNKYNNTPLHLAVLQNNYDDQIHMDIKDCCQQTPFLLSLSEGHLGMVHMFVSKGADVNAVDKDGNNCLHHVLKRKLFHSESEEMDVLDEICSQLSLNKEDRLSAVAVACYLAEEGANFHHKNKKNRTPLDIICNSNLKEKLNRFVSIHLQCLLCKDNQATVKFYPCKHTVTCSNCYSKKKLKKCIFLGIKVVELEIIMCDHPLKTVDQSFQMLYKWLNRSATGECTVNLLRKALEEAECFYALDYLQENREFQYVIT
ncbi:E3 ubiquitin-protein ligase MIB2-like [Octopus vulgaris]|uniref:E3 ubiquitin-protein ligase MIB2-like n=1 Tax=Octopus vulgaris TaxID=6645 RepID=A0AA36B2K5_OCTVU|nr:E3 ubiquitin-protein ligase MIB2-like [Octopus vulgaris]